MDYNFLCEGSEDVAYSEEGNLYFNIYGLYKYFHREVLPHIGIYTKDEIPKLFMDFFSAIELHEYGHVLNSKEGCTDHNQDCAWCIEVKNVFWHLNT